MALTLKIAVNLTVELHDPSEWTDAFGVEGAREIREDVRQYVEDMVRHGGVFGDGEVDADVRLR